MLVDTIGRFYRALPHFRGKGRAASVFLAPLIRGSGVEVIVPLSTSAGGCLLCNLDDWIPWNIFLFGSYRIEKPYEEFMMQFARDSKVAIDVGANIGYYTVQLARVSPGVVYAFEPFSYQYDVLRRNVRLNELHNVRIEKKCLSCESSVKRIYFSGAENTGSSSLEVPSEKFEDVPAVTLDDFVADEGLDEIGLVKIDVEGHELSVLKGMRATLAKKKIRHLFMEINNKALQQGRTSAAEVCDLLGQFGYTPRSIKTGREQPYRVGDEESLVYFRQ